MPSYTKEPARLANTNTSIIATGLMSDSSNVYYLSGAGAYVATRSIWSSLLSSNRTSYVSCWDWYRDAHLKAAAKDTTISRQAFWSKIPDSNYQYFCYADLRPNILYHIDTCRLSMEWAKHERERTPEWLAWDKMVREKIMDQLYLYLKNHTEWPVLRSWVSEIFHEAHARNLIRGLDAHGEVARAYLVEEQGDWSGLLRRLVIEGRIKFPEEETAA